MEPNRRGIHDKVNLIGLGKDLRRVEGKGLDALTGSFKTLALKIGTKLCGKRFGFVDGSVYENQFFASFPDALCCDGPSSSSPGSYHHDAKVLHVDKKFLVNGAYETGSVRVECKFPVAVEKNGVSGPQHG